MSEILFLGRCGEQNARSVEIDLRPLLRRWPGLTASLLARRPGEEEAYPADARQEGERLVWTISRADCALAGMGSAQAVLLDEAGTVAVRGEMLETLILPGLADGGETPEAMEPWVNRVLKAATLRGAYPRVTAQAGEEPVALQPNTWYDFGEVESLTVTLAPGEDDTVTREYCFSFSSGDTAATLTLPEEVRMANAAQIQAGKTCQVSILDGIGVMVCA